VKDLALDSFNWPGSAAFAMVALALTLGVLVLTGRVLGDTIDGHGPSRSSSP
jgi:hypothetical protein